MHYRIHVVVVWRQFSRSDFCEGDGNGRCSGGMGVAVALLGACRYKHGDWGVLCGRIKLGEGNQTQDA